jgi:hypothetical protein
MDEAHKPANALARRIINTLESWGYKPRAYSGREMYGAYCVGVDLTGTNELFSLGQHLTTGIPAPLKDDMGKGIIAYWPDAKLED